MTSFDLLIENMLKIDHITPVSGIIKNIQGLNVPEEYKLSDNRAEAILKILMRRKEKLQELL